MCKDKIIKFFVFLAVEKGFQSEQTELSDLKEREPSYTADHEISGNLIFLSVFING